MIMRVPASYQHHNASYQTNFTRDTKIVPRSGSGAMTKVKNVGRRTSGSPNGKQRTGAAKKEAKR
jgi:hypothetical protein